MPTVEADQVAASPSFSSILFERPDDFDAAPEEPPYSGDLHLDQVVSSLIAGREEYELAALFYHPLQDVEAVRYRHHVLRDLEREEVLEAVREFARGMRRMRECLGLVDKLYYERQKQRWFLESASVYCAAISAFTERLAAVELGSRGFLGFRDFLARYARSEHFSSLRAETGELADELAEVRYTVHIKGNRVRVNRYEGEPDISEEVRRTFARFQQGAVDKYRPRFRHDATMNHVEAQVLDLVAQLHQETFLKLEKYGERHRRYLDETIGRFDREVQFYLAYLDYTEPLRARGLAFSHPRVSAGSKDVQVTAGFDLALAAKLARERETVVCNDFRLADPERILVVSGPNNGGKTTLARMFGQVHYLASLGLPVPENLADPKKFILELAPQRLNLFLALKMREYPVGNEQAGVATRASVQRRSTTLCWSAGR